MNQICFIYLRQNIIKDKDDSNDERKIKWKSVILSFKVQYQKFYSAAVPYRFKGTVLRNKSIIFVKLKTAEIITKDQHLVFFFTFPQS